MTTVGWPPTVPRRCRRTGTFSAVTFSDGTRAGPKRCSTPFSSIRNVSLLRRSATGRRRRFTRPDQRRGEPLKQSINNGRLIQAILLLRRNVGSLRAVRDLLTDGAATGTKILR